MKKHVVSIFALSILAATIFSGCSSEKSESISLLNKNIQTSSLVEESSLAEVGNKTSANFFTTDSFNIFTLSCGETYKDLTFVDYDYQEPDKETGLDSLTADFTGDIELQGSLLLQLDGAIFFPDDEYIDVFPIPEMFIDSFKESGFPLSLETYLTGSEILALTKSETIKNQVEKDILIFEEDPSLLEKIPCTIRIDAYYIRYTPVSGARWSINVTDIKE